MKRLYWSLARSARALLDLPRAKLAERRLVGVRPLNGDSSTERVLDEVMQWLCRAQDASKFDDGGVARDYSLIHGWASSYPETTGYIVPTFLAYARRSGQIEYLARARRMVDWLVSIQLADGAFQGGKIDAYPVVPVTFNTGQVLLGLVAAEQHLGGYRAAMCQAADWLVAAQDADGCWRRFPSPFAAPGEKTYETHVAWGLFEAARLEPGRRYAAAAIANVRWAIELQEPNGWLDRCCLDSPKAPLTHTLGYALRGIIEAYRFTGEHEYLHAAERTADGLLQAFGPDGFLPGRLQPDWSPRAGWACVTGTAQIAHCLLLLHRFTRRAEYADCAFRANAFVRRTVNMHGRPEVRGGVKGSEPITGPYGRFEYLSWAAKFLADSLMEEIDLRTETTGPLPTHEKAATSEGAARNSA